MISLIICSRLPQIPTLLMENIEASIGVAYEYIIIDNSENKYSIFSAYNQGVQRSKYPILCFMHDDITYHTNNWGVAILDHFRDEKIGAIGISGSPYYPKMAGAWWSNGLVAEYIVCNGKKELTARTKQYSQPNNNGQEVVVLDGVWMCIRKKLFNSIRFDDVTFKGFHHYDVDICLQIHNCNYKMISINDVLIKHHSLGSRMNMTWLQNVLKVQKKWKKFLPATVVKLSFSKMLDCEHKGVFEYAMLQKENNLSYTQICKMFINQFSKYKLGFFYYKTIPRMCKYILRFRKKIISRA